MQVNFTETGNEFCGDAKVRIMYGPIKPMRNRSDLKLSLIRVASRAVRDPGDRR